MIEKTELSKVELEETKAALQVQLKNIERREQEFDAR